MTAELEPIRHELVLHGVRPARAFAAYVDLGSWWPGEYTPDAAAFRGGRIEPWPGGRVLFDVVGGEVEWGRVTEAVVPGADGPGLLVHTSTLAQPPEAPSLITVAFEGEDEATRVRFSHGGWRAGDGDLRAKFTDWPLILARYAAQG